MNVFVMKKIGLFFSLLSQLQKSVTFALALAVSRLKAAKHAFLSGSSCKTSVLQLALLLIIFLTACRPRERVTERAIEDFINYMAEGGTLELPVKGASGWTSKQMPFFSQANEQSSVIATLEAGRGFTILKEMDDWWQVEINGVIGWVINHFCMINIPDVIPSIPHNNTNAYASMFRSSGFAIPNITGKALYNSWDFNARLNREEFIAPVSAGTIRRIHAAQQAALADGNTLIMYEAFRPAAPHNLLYEELAYMARTNPIIYAGLNYGTFRSDFFLAPSPYNHQRGSAVDVSLAQILSYEIRTTGDFKYKHITGYTEFPMQTPMHELSAAAAVFTRWVPARTFTGWQHGVFCETATYGTRLLQRYMTDAGLTPLASEWWHFNDLNWSPPLVDVGLTGDFFIESTQSRPPLRQ